MFKRPTLASLCFLVLLGASFAMAGTPSFCDPDIFAKTVRIHTLQGEKKSNTPQGFSMPGTIIEGLVTKKVTKLDKSYHGVFIQEPSIREDGNPATSEGIFVEIGDVSGIHENDVLRVRGTVVNHYREARMRDVEEVAVCQPAGSHELSISDTVLPEGVILQEEQPGADSMDRYIGMKVLFSGVVARPFGFDRSIRRDSLTLARDIQFKSTQLFRPGQGAEEMNRLNVNNRITLVEGESAHNSIFGFYPDFNHDDYPLRVGSTVNNIPVVIGHAYGQYFMIPAGEWTTDTVTPPTDYALQRLEAPTSKRPGQHRIASLNLRNFFTDDGIKNAPSSGENRGAKNKADFQRQKTKLAHALNVIDADIIGLLEVGNNGKAAGSAIEHLVTTLNLNEPDHTRHYAFIFPEDAHRIGTSPISVGLIYRPHAFEPLGGVQILTMPEEITSGSEGEPVSIDQRDSMAQEFCVKGSGNDCLTIVVNHFKSKICSGCIDDPVDDSGEPIPGIQGCCNHLRTSAAVRLGEYLRPLDHAGKRLLALGDFNAYRKEDPIYVLTKNSISPSENIRVSSIANIPGVFELDKTQPLTRGYNLIDLSKTFRGDTSFSVNFNAELGSLDHAFSNTHLRNQITDVHHWHINSLESPLFYYDSKYSRKRPDKDSPYCCSDHDPLIIDMQLSTP